MSWIAINSRNDNVPSTFPATVRKSLGQPQTSRKTVSKYRVNILKAAEDLVNQRPRKRRCSKVLSKAKAAEACAKESALRRYNSDTEGNLNHEIHETSKETHFSFVQSLETSKNIETGLLLREDTDPKSVQHHTGFNLVHPKQRLGAASEMVAKSSNGARSDLSTTEDVNPGIHSLRSLALRAPEIDHTSRVDSLSDYSDSTMDISHREDLDFDQFDDNVFDEALQTQFLSERTDVPADPPTCKEKVFYPNKSPFPPFMHPCLFDSLDEKALLWHNKMTPSQPSKHTCFRTAEVIRLSKHFQSNSDQHSRELTLELFATVSKVEYANTKGCGQGIVFGDVFFPNKPPYISAMSRIPYSARGLASEASKGQDSKSIVKATISLSRKPAAARTSSFTERMKNSPSLHVDLLRTDPTGWQFEVLDVRTTSWTEIQDTKSMIEKDYNARYAGTDQRRVNIPPAIKDDAGGNGGLNHTSGRTTMQVVEGPLLTDYEDDFSDADISLPDIEELLRA